MYRRDLLLAEFQKLGLALARIMGLQQQGKLEEAENGLEEVLEKDFGILYTDLIACDNDNFMIFLTEKNYPAEKLDMFSQFLYLMLNIKEVNAANLSLAEKLRQIYQMLEVKHHVINMINLDRQKSIDEYLKINS